MRLVTLTITNQSFRKVFQFMMMHYNANFCYKRLRAFGLQKVESFRGYHLDNIWTQKFQYTLLLVVYKKEKNCSQSAEHRTIPILPEPNKCMQHEIN